MKYLVLLLCFVTTSVLAETRTIQITLPCDKSDTVFDIMKENEERLTFSGNTMIRESTTGQAFPAAMAIWMNLEKEENTGSITILFPDLTMCLLAPVTKLAPWSNPQPWEKQN